MSSPATGRDNNKYRFNQRSNDCDDEEEDGGSGDERDRLQRNIQIPIKKRKNPKVKEGQRERTRHYEVVGVVRKKVVFALR